MKFTIDKDTAEKLYKAKHISEKSYAALCGGGPVKAMNKGGEAVPDPVPTEAEVEAEVANEAPEAEAPQTQAPAPQGDESAQYRAALANDFKNTAIGQGIIGAGKGIAQNVGHLLSTGPAAPETDSESAPPDGPAQPASYDGNPQVPMQPGSLASDQAPPQVNPFMQAGAQMMGQGMQNINSSFDQQAKGIQGAADAQSSQAKATAEALHGAKTELDNLGRTMSIQEEQRQSDYDKHIATMQTVADQFNNSKIDPNRVFKNMSTPSKVLTLIGLALGGRAAPDMLNNIINRDIDAQKADIANKAKGFDMQNNIFGALREKGMDQQQATLAAKSIMLDRVEAMVKETAAQYQSPIAQANAKMALGHLAAEKGQLQMQMGQNLMNQSQFQGTPLAAISRLQDPGIKKMALEEYKNSAETTKQAQSLRSDFAKVDKLQTSGAWLKNPIQTKSQLDSLNLGLMALAKPLFGRVSETELNMLLKNNKIGYTDDPSTRRLKLNTILGYVDNKNPTPVLDSMGVGIKRLDLKPNE